VLQNINSKTWFMFCSKLWSNHTSLHLVGDNTTLRHYNKNRTAKAITQNNFTPRHEGQIQFQRIHQHFVTTVPTWTRIPNPLAPMSSTCNMPCHAHNTQCQLLTMASLKCRSAADHTGHLIPVPRGYFFLPYHTGQRRPLQHTILWACWCKYT